MLTYLYSDRHKRNVSLSSVWSDIRRINTRDSWWMIFLCLTRRQGKQRHWVKKGLSCLAVAARGFGTSFFCFVFGWFSKPTWQNYEDICVNQKVTHFAWTVIHGHKTQFYKSQRWQNIVKVPGKQEKLPTVIYIFISIL